jgi:16S rRNA (cytidine1402-2'-O)-methyltransferase
MEIKKGEVHLIPIALAEEGYNHLPVLVKERINTCEIFFAENIRTARRAFKKIDKAFDIDARTWFEIGNKEEVHLKEFNNLLEAGKTIGIVSESGCPGIADPGQQLIAAAQNKGFKVHPLTGPNSILLALMASGLNGQHFEFLGYLPITPGERDKKIKELERKSRAESCTMIFIETPYRNNQMFQSLVNGLNQETKLCIAYNLTSSEEWIKTKAIAEWKKQAVELPKQPAIFLIGN